MLDSLAAEFAVSGVAEGHDGLWPSLYLVGFGGVGFCTDSSGLTVAECSPLVVTRSPRWCLRMISAIVRIPGVHLSITKRVYFFRRLFDPVHHVPFSFSCFSLLAAFRMACV